MGWSQSHLVTYRIWIHIVLLTRNNLFILINITFLKLLFVFCSYKLPTVPLCTLCIASSSSLSFRLPSDDHSPLGRCISPRSCCFEILKDLDRHTLGSPISRSPYIYILTCSSAQPRAEIWTSDLPITSQPALPAELQHEKLVSTSCLMTSCPANFCVNLTVTSNPFLGAH